MEADQITTFKTRDGYAFRCIMQDLKEELRFNSETQKIEYRSTSYENDPWKVSNEIHKAHMRIVIQEFYAYFTLKGKKRAFYLSEKEYNVLEYELAKSYFE